MDIAIGTLIKPKKDLRMTSSAQIFAAMDKIYKILAKDREKFIFIDECKQKHHLTERYIEENFHIFNSKMIYELWI